MLEADKSATNDDQPDERGPVTFAVLGCGARGQQFADWVVRHPQAARVLAVADPSVERRDRIGDQHEIPAELRFCAWENLLARPRLADAVINTLMDRLHAPAGIAALGLGYHMLLEKPMAVSLADCIALEETRRGNSRITSVCHSLRYHPTYRRVKQLVDAGAIGQVMSIDQLEGVEPVHQAHSFVRGNWGNEARSTFMLLAKSCHDIDILMHLVDRPCLRVSSFGSLSHFTADNKPAGAPERCSDGCRHEVECPYSALKVYGQGKSWGRYIGLDRLTQDQRDDFVRTSDYGKCVYGTDNDVVDHQVVSFEFEGGATGTFTMTAFAPAGRKLRVHGSHGFISADVEKRRIELHRSWGPGAGVELIDVPQVSQGTHDGCDDLIMESLVGAIRANDPSLVLTGSSESLRTHTVAFAAEIARCERRVVEIAELAGQKRASPRLQLGSLVNKTIPPDLDAVATSAGGNTLNAGERD
jgi:predicted dehydrogenase